MKRNVTTISFCLGLGAVATVALLWLLGGGFPVVKAQGPDSIDTYYVAPGGSCGTGISPCYASVQAAVDAADDPGDVVKVAGGNYTGAQGRPAPMGYDGPSTVSQTVYISKTLTVRGGYTITDWTASDPDANPTVLDALGQGRVVFIAGDISPTIEGLGITGGDATGLGGGWLGAAGGGMYVISGTITLGDCQIFSNTSPETGGGLYLTGSIARLRGNSIVSNTCSTMVPMGTSGGGGLYLDNSTVTLLENAVAYNSADDSGGAMYVRFSDARISGNEFTSNSADSGGGLKLWNSDVVLGGNTFTDNTATGDRGGGDGGGLYLAGGKVLLDANSVISNAAHRAGGGLWVVWSEITVTNSVIADNQADTAGSGLSVNSSSALLLHTTIAHNTGGNGRGIDVKGAFMGSDPSTVALSNTILVSHTVGIDVSSGNTATLEATLWGSGGWANGTDWTGDVTTGTVNVWGDPGFVDPDSGDYHIGSASAARDSGVYAGITTDIDGDPRPMDFGYDIGADEYGDVSLEVVKRASSEIVQAGEQLTYTIRVTNTGNVDLHATVTDVLPSHVTPTGVLTWTPTIAAPGGVWEQTAVVTVETGYSGVLTNTVQVTTEEGASGSDTEKCTSIGGYHIYLPLVLRQYP